MEGSIRPFRCSICSRSFTRQENLKRHVRTHHQGDQGRTFACSRCGSCFSRSDLRKRHTENCHASQAQESVQEASAAIRSSSTLPAKTGDSNGPAARAPLAASSNVDSDEMPAETAYSSTFLLRFHRSFPVLHEPSFIHSSPPVALLRATACIGAFYCKSEHDLAISRTLFKKGLTALSLYVNEDRSRYQQEWVLQAFILYEFYGLYSGDDSLFQEAITIHTNLVDAVRLFQMTRDTCVTSSSARLDKDEMCTQSSGSEAHTLETKWQSFILQESRKRCIYALYILDSQRAIMCNLRPIISSLEIKNDLPCDEDLWLAQSAEQWANLEAQKFKSFNESEDFLAMDEAFPESSFYESTNYLLHSDSSTRTPTKLRLLWSSPFAALILVTQLQMVSRELTHAACLLKRPTFSQRNLSLLTESQYSQISQALQSIADLVPESSAARSNADSRSWPQFSSVGFDLMSMSSEIPSMQSHSALWNYFWRMWHYTSITLSHPDALLVRGVVETSLPGAIATAGHLARPRSKAQRDIYEDRDVFRLLKNLDQSLRELVPSEIDAPIKATLDDENPFATILGYKTSLTGWRLLRLTMNDFTKPSVFVRDTLVRACSLTMRTEDVEAVALEVAYLGRLVQAFMVRDVWPVGCWVGKILDEMALEAKSIGVSLETVLNAAPDNP